jgi:hypothetical protein
MIKKGYATKLMKWEISENNFTFVEANTPASYSGDLGSYLGPETGYPNWGFWRLSSVPPGECRDSTFEIAPQVLPSKSFVIYHSRTTLLFDSFSNRKTAVK